MKKFLRLLFSSFQEWKRDRCGSLAAAMSFFALLSLAPFMVFILWISSWFLGMEGVREQLVPMLESFYGAGSETLLRMLFEFADLDPSRLSSSTIVGGLLCLWASTEYFIQVKDSLEVIWGEYRDEFGIKDEVKDHAMGVALAVVLAFLIAIFLVVRVKLHLPFHGPRHWVDREGVHVTDVLFAFVPIWAVNLTLYRLFIPRRMKLLQAIRLAALTAAFQLLGRWISIRILPDFPTDAAESLAVCIVLLLIWTYYSSMVFLYGAELAREICEGTKNAE